MLASQAVGGAGPKCNFQEGGNLILLTTLLPHYTVGTQWVLNRCALSGWVCRSQQSDWFKKS